MTDYLLTLGEITKIYGRRLIFNNINYSFQSSSVYGIAGANGSGKSTLAKIICGIISPTSGKVTHKSKGKELAGDKLFNHIGFVSPYLILYDEFTALENLKIISQIRGIEFDSKRADYLLSEFNIYDRRNDYLKAYSSGMKQRMKFVFALLHKPQLILLDEPTSNLDDDGKKIVYGTIEKESKENLIIIASNESGDLALCKDKIQIEEFKNKE